MLFHIFPKHMWMQFTHITIGGGYVYKGDQPKVWRTTCDTNSDRNSWYKTPEAVNPRSDIRLFDLNTMNNIILCEVPKVEHSDQILLCFMFTTDGTGILSFTTPLHVSSL